MLGSFQVNAEISTIQGCDGTFWVFPRIPASAHLEANPPLIEGNHFLVFLLLKICFEVVCSRKEKAALRQLTRKGQGLAHLRGWLFSAQDHET